MARGNSKQHGGDELIVSTSSGYNLIVQRPPMQVLRAVQRRAEELYPLPEPPSEELQLVTGQTERVNAVDLEKLRKLDLARNTSEQQAVLDTMTDAEIEYWQARQWATYQQNEYLLDWALQRRVNVEGAYTEKQRQELIEKFSDQRAELEEYGSLDEELLALDPYQFVLRVFIIQDASDYAAVSAAVMRSLDASDLDPAEVRARAKFLRS